MSSKFSWNFNASFYLTANLSRHRSVKDFLSEWLDEVRRHHGSISASLPRKRAWIRFLNLIEILNVHLSCHSADLKIALNNPQTTLYSSAEVLHCRHNATSYAECASVVSQHDIDQNICKKKLYE